MEGKFWRRGPNLPPFSTLSTDLGHFILKLLHFDIFVYFLYLFSRFFFGGGGVCHFMPLVRAIALNVPSGSASVSLGHICH